MNTGKELRLRRIWKQGRAVIIPFDHGQYGGTAAGLDDPVKLAETIASTNADAVLVTPALLEKIAGSLGDLGVILRLDGAFTKYTPIAGDYQPICSPQQAVRLGADAGIVFTFVGTEFDSASLQRLGATSEEASTWGLPLVAEILPPGLLNNHFEREVFRIVGQTGTIEEQTTAAARIGAEHGADIIKTRYSGSVDAFRKTVAGCTARVVVAGGPPGTDTSVEGLLAFASDCVKADAAGIVFGRSVWQKPNMKSVIDALCAVVHGNEPVSSALKLVR